MAERTPAVGAHLPAAPTAQVGVSSTGGTVGSTGKQSPRSKDGKVFTASDSGEPMIHETDHPRH